MSDSGDAPPAGGAPAYPPPVDRDDLGNGPLIMSVTWIFIIIAMGFVAARLLARRANGVRWTWDDYFMLAAVTLQLALQALLARSYTEGLGKHDHSLYLDELITILKHNWVSVPPGILVGLLSRASIAGVLSRVFAPYKWFTIYLYSFTALMWVTGIALMPITFLQIKPVEALWDITIVPTSAWSINVWLYTTYFFSALSAFSDLTYALFPVIFIWKLNMPVRQRVGLIIVMCGSIISMIMAIMKARSFGEVAKVPEGAVDVQFRASTQLIYGFTEQALVIIMGCIPSLRAVFKLDFSQLSIVRKYYSYRSKQSASEYSSSGYADLGKDSHNLSHIGMSKGVTQASVGRAGSLASSGHHGGSNDQLVDQGKIVKTNKYSVTYNPNENKPREIV
jgi:hypothetical protein